MGVESVLTYKVTCGVCDKEERFPGNGPFKHIIKMVVHRADVGGFDRDLNNVRGNPILLSRAVCLDCFDKLLAYLKILDQGSGIQNTVYQRLMDVSPGASVDTAMMRRVVF